MNSSRNKLPTLVLLGVIMLIFISGAILLRGKSINLPTPGQTSITNYSRPTESITMVSLEKNGFNPTTITVKPGTRVIWTNKSGLEASVNSDPHPAHNLYPVLQLGVFNDGSSVQTVFTQAGTYTYHNHLNPTQKGTVIVK